MPTKGLRRNSTASWRNLDWSMPDGYHVGMKITDTGGLRGASPMRYVKIVGPNDRLVLSIMGPTDNFCTVDFFHHNYGEWGHIGDQQMCRLFHDGMDVGAWFDLLAERRPEYQWAADLYGKLMSEMV